MSKVDEARRQHAESRAARDRALEPVLRELREAGEDTTWFLQHHVTKLAISVLIRWLPRVADVLARRAIVKALTTKLAKPLAAQALIDQFRAETDETTKSLIGMALAEAADTSVYDDIRELAMGTHHGAAREGIVQALSKMKRPEVADIVIALMDDPTAKYAASMAASNIRSRTDETTARIRAKNERNHETGAAARELALAPMLRDLASAGHDPGLFNSYSITSPMVPLLLRWLPRLDNPLAQASIATALQTSVARPAATADLLRLFKATVHPGVKNSVGSAFFAIADDSHADDVLETVLDMRHGLDRAGLVFAMGKMTDPRVPEVLVDLLDDPDAYPYAIEVAGKLRLANALPGIRPYLKDKRGWVRMAAKKAIKRIENQPRPAPPKLVDVSDATDEVSVNFDLEHVQPFLKRMAKLVKGFGAPQIRQVMDAIEELEHDQECELGFRVTHDGTDVGLRIHVFMSDLDSPDIAFFAPPLLATAIDKLIVAFGDERGM